MKKIFLFAVLIFFCGQVSPLEFSPTSLEFNLEKNQQDCKNIFVKLDGQTSITNFWTEDENAEWRISQFQTSSQELEITVEHSPQISQSVKEVEVCISGERSGNYRGALIFRQQESGNSIVQFVVWINLTVTGENEQSEETSSTKRKSGRSSNDQLFQQSASQNSVQKFEEIDFEQEEKIKLNSPAKKQEQKILLPGAIIIALALILTIVAFVLVRK